MKTVIYYFSGTGNTEMAVNLLASELIKKCEGVDLIRMEEVLRGNRPLGAMDYDMVGFASPVYAYGTPRIVDDFIALLPPQRARKAFILRTAGGVAPINYNASKSMIRKLARKGYDVFYERILSLGSNWIAKFDDAVVRRLYRAAQEKAHLMGAELMEGEGRILRPTVGWVTLTGLIHFLGSMTFRLVGKDYRVDDSCDHCGRCQRNCPMGNIAESKGRLRFKYSCISCMRCIYSCPRNAIHLGFFSFFVVPGGYDVAKTLASPAKDDTLAGKKVPPFFPAYIENDRA
jgi:ferredoxin/flavodoxin